MKKILVVSSLLIMTLVAVQKVQAAFVDTYWGVRALGMGGAYTAVSDDANAPLYNIAGIAFATQQEVTLMGSRLFAGVEGVEIAANYFGYVYPLAPEWGAISVAWSSTSVPGLRREDTFNFGYARMLNDIMRIDSDYVELSAGLNLKYLMQETKFDEEDADLESSKGAMTADVGVMAKFANGIGIGYSSKYFIPADIGYMEKDEVKNVNVLGLSYYNDMLPYVKIPYFTVAADVIFRDNDTFLKMGAETYLIDGRLALRLGGRKEAFDFGFGYSFEFGNDTALTVDYAFELPFEIKESYGSHFISLSFRF
ncbi:MAG: hypothetical protein II816_03385 [Elusimicrobia bacterium]|nr:hypothetical protein [Elusimicrobiota bacterium]